MSGKETSPVFYARWLVVLLICAVAYAILGLGQICDWLNTVAARVADRLVDAASWVTP